MKSFTAGLLSLALFGNTAVFGKVCDDELECAYTTMDDEDIYCRGYLSCYKANSTSEEDTYVQGNLAAYDAILISEYDLQCNGYLGCLAATMNISNDFYCRGGASCAYSDTWWNDDAYIYGNFALLGANLTGGTTTDIIYNYGLGGAYGATIETVYKMYNYGYLSAAYATINSGDSDTVRLYNYGSYAGYGLVLNCNDEATCRVWCDSTGCNNLTINCGSDATCSYSCSSSCDECPTIVYEDDDSESMNQIENNRQVASDFVQKTLWNKMMEIQKEIGKPAGVQNPKYFQTNYLLRYIEDFIGIKESHYDDLAPPTQFIQGEQSFLPEHNFNDRLVMIEEEEKEFDNEEAVETVADSQGINLPSFAAGVSVSLVLGLSLFYVSSGSMGSKYDVKF